jgi:CHAT domain
LGLAALHLKDLDTALRHLAKGTQQVVASVLSAPDVDPTQLMVAFHRLLANGEAAPSALARAQQQAAVDDPGAVAAAAGFVCIGGQFVFHPGATLAKTPALSGH